MSRAAEPRRLAPGLRSRWRRYGPRLVVAAWVLLLPIGVRGQSVSDRAARAIDGIELRELGPALMGGRIADLAVVEDDPRIVYVGYATGGVWKTTSAGMAWEPVFDDQPTASIGAVTVAPSNPNVVWVGRGEPQNRLRSRWGAGVFGSRAAGRSWEARGLADTKHIARIVVHPVDP
ncbi:MAG: hypothetical protein R3266_06950, partial [Gemmatimonadota bacterium]|nr:hypothetical protein [Gemmatimonadota bacterium]